MCQTATVCDLSCLSLAIRSLACQNMQLDLGTVATMIQELFLWINSGLAWIRVSQDAILGADATYVVQVWTTANVSSTKARDTEAIWWISVLAIHWLVSPFSKPLMRNESNPQHNRTRAVLFLNTKEWNLGKLAIDMQNIEFSVLHIHGTAREWSEHISSYVLYPWIGVQKNLS